MKKTRYQNESLDRNTAASLAEDPCELVLSLGELSYDACIALENFQGNRLRFEPNLPAIDDQTAQELIEIGDSGRLSIAWLRSSESVPRITPSNFLTLTQFADSVEIDDTDILYSNEISLLNLFQGDQLIVDVDSLTTDSAIAIAGANPDLLSIHLDNIDESVALALATSQASERLEISTASPMDKDSATGLLSYRGDSLCVKFEHTPLLETIHVLSQFNGHLELYLPEITLDIAKELTTPSTPSHTLALHPEISPDESVAKILRNTHHEIINLIELIP